MLKKIVAIKNVGRFQDSASGGDTTFAKHTLIFGANGFGKTTICSILRSLRMKDASHISGRKTLGSTGHQSVHLQTSSDTIKFNGTDWSGNKNELVIFDDEFVLKNVHSGDVVDTDQKRNLYRIIIGDAGVKLAEDEAELVVSIRTATTTGTALKKSIDTHLPKGLTTDGFIKLGEDVNIDEKILAQEIKINTIRESAKINSTSALLEINIPALPDGLEELLAKTIENVSEEAEKTLNAHLVLHQMSLTDGKKWLEVGTEHTTETCAFCGQNVDNNVLIATYKAFFSDAYKILQGEIKTIRDQINAGISEVVLAQIDSNEKTHNASVTYWESYCEMDIENLKYPENIKLTLKTLKDAALALVNKKMQTPFEGIELDKEFIDALANYNNVKKEIADFNKHVDLHNILISNKKTETTTSNIDKAIDELSFLQAVKKRHTASIKKICDEYSECLKEKKSLEGKKNAIRSQLDTYTASIIRPYENRINELLEDFNAGFQIAETKHNYTGGIATSSYELVINKVSVAIGNSSTPNNIHSFRNTLSKGDKSTLAIAFFIANLEKDTDLQDKIIVFDDPFNSQDAFRRLQTVLEIQKLGTKAKQIVVLSHDPSFLKQIWDKCTPSERKALNLIDHGDKGTKIGEFDIEKASMGLTIKDINDIQSFVSNGRGEHIDIIRKLRTVLESYLRSTYVNAFDSKEWLGDMLKKIRDDEQHPAKAQYEVISAINEYSSSYHHGENKDNATSQTIDGTELKGFAKKALKIVNAMQS